MTAVFTQNTGALTQLKKLFPANNLKKSNKNAKPNKDIFLHPKI